MVLTEDFAEDDYELIQEVHQLITSPDPDEWNADVVHWINTLSNNTLTGAIQRGKLLAFGLRTRGIRLSAEDFKEAGIHLDLQTAKYLIEIASHKSYCEHAPSSFRDQRIFGTRPGEAEIVQEIRDMDAMNYSQEDIAKSLNQRGRLPRKGKWNQQMVSRCLLGLNRPKGQPCACRMFRLDWVMPQKWSICVHLMKFSDRAFERFLDTRKPKRHCYHATKGQIDDFKKTLIAPPPSHPLPPVRVADNKPVESKYLDAMVFGDCYEKIGDIANKSLSAVITSPPYAKQRGQYEGIAPEVFPDKIVELLELFRPKLKDDASIFIIIRPHVEDGRVHPYVDRMNLAIQDAGWIRPGLLKWYKPDAPPLGAIDLPRACFEDIYWYSLTPKPYKDLFACGKPSTRIGLQSHNPHGNIDGVGIPTVGVARIKDVIEVPVGSCDVGIDHPAIFPPDLPRFLIRSFTPDESLICDPFCGSGTTCLVGQSEGRHFIGFDNGVSANTGEPHAMMAMRRARTEAKYAWRAAIREREEQTGVPERPSRSAGEMPDSKLREQERAVARAARSGA